jgi:hypothetical protein
MTIRMLPILESMMASSQAIISYTKLDMEDELEKKIDTKLKKEDYP